MDWLSQTLDVLSKQPAIGYGAGAAPAAEPTAIATLAFVAQGHHDFGEKMAQWLAKEQQASGAVGVRSGEPAPGWPTSLAVVAWAAAGKQRFGSQINNAVAWLLSHRGKAVDRSRDFGHNTELVGWAYAEQTHSWVEPTAFGVLALRAAGKSDDPVAREGVAVLIDRQLPGGGLNYGNTYVLGQALRSHVQPTGIALVALAGHHDGSGRLEKSIAWLKRSIGPETTPQSLGWALLGLQAQGVELPQADEWLAAAAAHVNQHDRSPHKFALLALAAKGWPK